MRSEAPPLAPIFRSSLQAELLALTLLHAEREQTITELARQLGAPLSTVHGEVGRLVEAEILTARSVGRARLLRPAVDNPIVLPLTHLMMVAYGPRTVVPEEFATVSDIDLLAVFGSWAARYRGEPGPPPNDVDVLVVGAPRRRDVYAAADRAERRLRRPVNPTVMSPGRWEAADDALVRQIRASPLVVLRDVE